MERRRKYVKWDDVVRLRRTLKEEDDTLNLRRLHLTYDEDLKNYIKRHIKLLFQSVNMSTLKH